MDCGGVEVGFMKWLHRKIRALSKAIINCHMMDTINQSSPLEL